MEPRLSTVPETLDRLNSCIASLECVEHRRQLEIFRDHWYGEAVGDIELTMSTLTDSGELSYRLDGFSVFGSKRWPDIWRSRESTEKRYHAGLDGGVNVAGPLDEETFCFGASGLSFEAVFTFVKPGFALPVGLDIAIDASKYYMLRVWAMHYLPMDMEKGRMIGEHGYFGTPFHVEEVSYDQVSALLGNSGSEIED